jgi:hypothetical protein
MKAIYITTTLFFLFGAINAKTIKVPTDQPKIQTAINAASNGDTILVSPGRYFENINFNAKKIVLTSYYLFKHDTSYIRATIIDGSKPNRSDSASCIRILKGQDSTTVLQGFTITGGQGTNWKDEHSAGTYREGGGIIVALSSPVIQNNHIINNEAINKTGLSSAGGGGIRCGDGNPKILNNVIINNNARYGGGIVLNYCNAIICNNIIISNEGGQDFGGGGIWINGTNGKTNIIENNTIVSNNSTTSGGGVFMYNTNAKATLKNNIIYGNIALVSPQITIGSAVIVSYCDIAGGWVGTGNFDLLPKFTEPGLYLSNSSPCIDAGDPNQVYNDLPNNNNSSNALFPSLGELKNDIGAYGGPNSKVLPSFKFSRIGIASNDVSMGTNNIIGVTVKKNISILNQSIVKVEIDSVKLVAHNVNLKITHFPTDSLTQLQSDSIQVEWTPTENKDLTDTVLIYHNTPNIENPVRVIIIGKVKKPDEAKAINEKTLFEIFPNPAKEVVTLKINDASANQCLLYDTNGQFLRKWTMHYGKNEINISHLTSGVYLLAVNLHNDVYNQKLIIQ